MTAAGGAGLGPGLTPELTPNPGPVPMVVCVGDVMMDVLARLPSELQPGSDRPAPITTTGGGAAANTAAWLVAAGAAATLVGQIGRDPFGAWLTADLAARGIVDVLVRDSQRPTGTCIVLVSPDGERTMVPDAGANAGLRPPGVPVDVFAAGRHLHLSGYTLFGPARGAGQAALARARSAGMTVSVDAASAAPLRDAGPRAFLDWIGTDLLLLANRDEAFVLTALDDPVEAARSLAGAVGSAVVKLGADGAVWSDGVQVIRRAAGEPDVVDTTGAGDAFAAGFLAAVLGGVQPGAALERGHILAATACGQVGGRPAPP